MPGYLSTGYVAKTVEEYRAEIVAELLSKVDPTFDLSDDNPLGQVVASVCERLAILDEAVATLANALDPDAAEDFLLDFLCSLQGTTREPARKTTVSLNCNVDASFSATANQILVNVDGQSEIQFRNVSAVGPLSAGTHAIDFACTEYGPIPANAGTITVITAPVSGLNSVTNPLDATIGADREQDAALAERRETEISAPGASTVDSIRADVLQVAGVQQCFVFENVLLETDSDGVPGKAFEVVIFDGEVPAAVDADVTAVVFGSKPSGAQTWGTESVQVTDDTGTVHEIKFSRADVQEVYLTLEDVVVNANEFPENGITLIKDAIVAKAVRIQNLGVDVISLKMKSAAESVPGVIDVPTLKLGFTASPTATANLAIGGREIADIDTSRIEVSTVNGTP